MPKYFARFAVLLAAVFAILGYSLEGANAAQVTTHYSNALAGFAVEGNGLQPYNDIRGTFEDLPDLTAVTSGHGVGPCASVAPSPTCVQPQEIAVGVALGQNVSVGGKVYGLGLVWDANGPSTCNWDQWTVEYGGTGINGYPANVGGPAPVATGALVPVKYFGADVCVSPGGSEYLDIQQSTKFGELNFLFGTEFTNENVGATAMSGIFTNFEDPGIGVTACSVPTSPTIPCPAADNGAAALPNGTLFTTYRVGLTELANNGKAPKTKRITFSAASYAEYLGTANGGPVTPSNAATLTPSPDPLGGISTGSAFSVNVP